jgi:hypothetical protein
VNFFDVDLGIEIFASSYLMENRSKAEVADLIIEMAADDEEYEIIKNAKWEFLDRRSLFTFILEDQACKELYGKRLTENKGNLKRLFSKDRKDNNTLVMNLIMTAIEYGEAEVVKEILQETNQKRETWLHRIAKNTGSFLGRFLESVEMEDLVDNFEDWLLMKDSDGKTFLFYLDIFFFERVFEFIEEIEMDEKNIEKLLLEKDNQGETFLFNRHWWKQRETLEDIARISNKNILRELLIIRNNENENFLVTSEFYFIEILKFTKETFPNDLELLKSLFNDKNIQGVHFMEKIQTDWRIEHRKKVLELFSENFTEDELKEIFGDDFRIIFVKSPMNDEVEMGESSGQS